ncbi:GGDEF domain-containing protein [Massilia oculi]|uniref:GGDEF domain-containing protein n=1 Tax=Massilia oculi TaxID=945844 RepID=UPI0028A76821|nr:GGDEF domain-containing protein [Massilia oculi]
MSTEVPLYRHQVLFLSQSFFIKDNRAELLLHAHKYDFDILFFSEVAEFTAAVAAGRSGSLFVIDLDALHNMQADLHDSRKTLMLGELLERLPREHSYVYLQSGRQGSRFLLQQRLVDSNCLAYAEKPIANDVLVDKLFNLFVRTGRGDPVSLVYLGAPDGLDATALQAQRVEVVHHPDATTLHLRVKELQPDMVVIPDDEYRRLDALARVMKKNIEADPVREIVLLQRCPDDALARRALGDGFDTVLQATSGLVEAQLANRAARIRVSKDLIGKDRATGLLNKVGLQRKTQDLIRQATLEDKPLAFGVIDIDKFKTINDTWGHHFGDIVIKRLCLCLAPQMGERDLLARFGGEEFVLVFWDCALDVAWRRLDALRQAFGAVEFQVAPGELRRFSFSGGLAAFPDHRSENELFLRADAMLYTAKESGRNRICPT